MTLDYAIDAVMKLPFEQQEMLLEIIRRREMAQDARESITAFRTGQLKPQSLPNIMAELRQI